MLSWLSKYHRSSFVCFSLLLAVIVLVNLPGQIVVHPDVYQIGQYGRDYNLYDYYEHGWPLVYLQREPVSLNQSPIWRLSCWNVWDGVRYFKPLWLILDSLAGLAVALAVTFFFERWRRRRQRLLQFHISDLLILTGLISLAGAFVAWNRSEYMAEQTALETMEEYESSGVTSAGGVNDRIEWQPGGPTWLRRLVGDRLFESSNRVALLEATENDLEHAVHLRQLKVVRLWSASNEDMKLLGRLPQLEALDMLYARVTDKEQRIVDEDGTYDFVEAYFELPRLPQLRGLNLYGATFRGDGLRNIPSVEVLDLSDTDVGDDSIPALASLTKLKELSLYNTEISEDGLRQLRQALPTCEVLP